MQVFVSYMLLHLLIDGAADVCFEGLDVVWCVCGMCVNSAYKECVRSMLCVCVCGGGVTMACVVCGCAWACMWSLKPMCDYSVCVDFGFLGLVCCLSGMFRMLGVLVCAGEGFGC